MQTISIKNTWVWFKDQMTHPSTLFSKTSWGVFSPYAHYRRSDHRPKQTYATREKALSVAKEMGMKYGGSYSIYKCVFCDGWHVAKDSHEEQPQKKVSQEPGYVPTSKTLDVEKILATNIPDIHPVYGGVRGRTLSSSHQAYAWPTVIEAGIRTIIDLREDGVYSRLSEFCEQSGIRYFYYPVDKRARTIEKMIELFPELCKAIDAGNFYIACAQGLHRTDIALCTYWVFYAADKGIAPPAIRGYRQEDGHDTSKIMCVLNAFYNRLTELNGEVPIPMQVFVQRKQIINQLSKKRENDSESQDKQPEPTGKKRVYVDMDGALADYNSGLAKVSEELKTEYRGRFDEIPGLYSLMNPIPGAIEAMQRMQKDDRFDVYVISTAPWNNPSSWTDKLLWVQKHLDDVFHRRLILTHSKDLLKGDYLIDAHSKNGTRQFEGEWIMFGSNEFPDWESLMRYFNVK